MTSRIGRYAERYAIVLAAIVLAGIFSIAVSGFFTVANFENMAAAVPVSMLAAVGLTIPLASGDFDLSVGPILGLAGAMVVDLNVVEHQNIAEAIVLTLVASVLIGMINGALVVVFKLNALIATLATGTIFTGVTLEILNNETVSGVSSTLQHAMLSSVGGIPTPFIAVIVVSAVLWFVHQHTPVGRQLTMAGEGREAARLSGVRVDYLRFSSFVLAAFLYGVAGIMLVGEVGAADPTSGTNYTLPAFAAAFLGATAIQIGRFNIWGTVIAICFVQIGVTGLALIGLQSWIVEVFQGGVLLAAVGFARFAGSRSIHRSEGDADAQDRETTTQVETDLVGSTEATGTNPSIAAR